MGRKIWSFFSRFARLQPSVLAVILSEFCLQMTHNAFFLVANFYLTHHGYSDAKIAEMLSARFLLVLVISLPLGFILGRMRLLPLLRIAGLVTPLGYGLFLYAVPRQDYALLYGANALIGLSMAVFQVIVVPYIMRNEVIERQSDAIALSFSNWSTTTFVLGLGFFLLNHWRDVPIAESTLLVSMIGFSLLGLVVLLRSWNDSVPEGSISLREDWAQFEWGLIAKILAPSVVIGVGAGLSIPFMSLFFRNVFAMSYEDFSLVSSLTTFFVSFGSIYGPSLQRKFGYAVAILWTQSLAILALAVLGLSEMFAPAGWAMVLAIVCYMFRQPLMNMANPVISEWTMHQVGPRNRELTSALKQALWAASWFSSSQIFRLLRDSGLAYMWVFCSTAAIYALGVLWYARLIKMSPVTGGVVTERTT